MTRTATSRRNARAIAIGAVLALIAVLWYWQPWRPTTAEFMAAMGGDEVIRLIRAAKTAQAYRIHPPDRKQQLPEVFPAAYPIITGPVSVAPETVAPLRDLLLRPKSYSWKAAYKECTFDPGVRTLFEAEGHTIDVLFCFECDQLQIYRDQKYVAALDIDPSRPEFVRIVKQLLPNDPDISALTEDRHARAR